MTPEQTPSQKRARAAMGAVREFQARLNAGEQAELKSHAKALPFLIHTSGLGQAAAFYRSKQGRQGDLYEALSQWLCAQDPTYREHGDLLEAIVECSQESYLAAQVEAIAYLEWLVKFAVAFLADRPTPLAAGAGPGSTP